MDPKKISIVYTPAACVGNGECIKNDPSLFGFNDASKKAILKGGHHVGNEVVADVSGSAERIKYAIRAAASCPVNAFVVKDAHTQTILVGNTVQQNSLHEIRATYDDAKEFVLDTQGYFLIRVNYEQKEIEAGFCNSKNNLILKVMGKKPIDIYHAIATHAQLQLRPEHYAYLGRELEKAHFCLVKDLAYVQDDALESMKPRKK